MTGKMATIVGVNGGFGRMFADKLHDEGWLVHGVDLIGPDGSGDGSGDGLSIGSGNGHESALESLHKQVLVAEESSNSEVDQWLQKSSLIMLCVPTKGALWWLDHGAGLFSSNSLCLDILSIKTEITHRVLAAGLAGEYLSLHPMFAPRGVFNDLTMAMIRVKNGPLSEDFMAMIKKWGCKIISMNSDDHDKASAVMQAGVHAILLAMGRAAKRSGVSKETLAALATPVSGPVSDLITIITDGDPNTYAAIQKENPHARAIREALIDALADLGQWSDECDSISFKKMVDEIREGDGPKC